MHHEDLLDKAYTIMPQTAILQSMQYTSVLTHCRLGMILCPLKPYLQQLSSRHCFFSEIKRYTNAHFIVIIMIIIFVY